jgi:hypothetical protein
LTTTQADRLAALVDELTLPVSGTFSTCFYGGPAPILALISYRAGPGLTVYADYGCSGALSNGTIARTGSAGRIRQLYRFLLGVPASGR